MEGHCFLQQNDNWVLIQSMTGPQGETTDYEAFNQFKNDCEDKTMELKNDLRIRLGLTKIHS